MENKFLAKAGTLFGKEKFTSCLLLIMFFCIITGCASSDVSRDAAAGVDLGVQNAKNMGESLTEGSIGDTYQNTSQATKGAVIGGAVGLATGSLVTGIGVLPGAIGGAVLGASYGSYIDSLTSQSDRIENRGVNIIVLGDQILIVIPSSRIFQALTPSIKPTSYSTLDAVAQYINTHTKTLVKISAYTNFSGSLSADKAMSQEQAEAVEKYLAAAGVNARLLYAKGYGGSRLVQKNDSAWYGNENYRIEITFEKLYV